MLTGENGLLTKAQTSKTKSAQEEARERVSLMLAEWKIDNATEGVTIQEYLESTEGKYYNQIQAQGIDNIVEELEDKEYIATVIVSGTSYEVIINTEDSKNPYIGNVQLAGKRVSIIAEIVDYVLDTNVNVKVSATAPDGQTIEKVEWMRIKEDKTVEESGELEVTKVNGTLKVEGTISITTNGKYIFKATSNEGIEKQTKEIEILIVSTPEIESVTDITYQSFKINLKNKVDSEKVQYKYYVKKAGETELSEFTNDTVTGLSSDTDYNVIVRVYIGENYKEVTYAETVHTKFDDSWVIEGRVHNVSTENALLGTAGGRSYYKTNDGAAIGVGFYVTGARFALVSTSENAVKGYCEQGNGNSEYGSVSYGGRTWYYQDVPLGWGDGTGISTCNVKNMGVLTVKSPEEIIKAILADYFIEDNVNIEITDIKGKSFKINLQNTKDEYQYEYYIKKKADSDWTKIDSNEATGLEELTEYNVKVITILENIYKETVYDNTVKTKMQVSWDENGNPYNISAAGELGTAGGRTYYKKYDGNAIAFACKISGAQFGLISKDADAALGYCSYNTSKISSTISFEYNNETWYYSILLYGWANGTGYSSINCPYIGTVSTDDEELAKLVLDMCY